MNYNNCLVFIILITAISNSFGQIIDYKKFEGKKIKIAQIAQINKPFIYDYEANSSNGLDSLIFNNFPNNNTAESILKNNTQNFLFKEEGRKNNFLKLKYKFTFEDQGNLISIIKYREVIDNIISPSKCIVLKKNKNNWEKVNSVNIKSIVYVVQKLSIESFWQFYNNENKDKYAEINKLKPLVKDASGILNIEKLAKVIEKNKGTLSKYLNE